ncbi:MAG: GNAT family N-acetyltransferase [Clostridia bacterium]|nr:GNAT family N-acetyltransferase [Clostridia bacterium]
MTRRDVSGFSIREMTQEDGQAVLAIYAQGIRGNLATFTADVPDWETWDRAHRPDCRLVLTEEGRVVGFAALMPVSAAAGYAGAAEESVYLDASAVGRGGGKALLAALIETSEAAGVWTLEAVITAENLRSIALHQALGFRVVGRRERPGFTPDGVWHDTVILERRSRRVRPDGLRDVPDALRLTLLPQLFCVAKLPLGASMPDVPGILVFAETGTETSFLCEERFLPETALDRETGFRAFRAEGPLDFSLTGILADITAQLAAAQVSVFAVSTFDTDWVLVRQEKLRQAIRALAGGGYRLIQE